MKKKNEKNVFALFLNRSYFINSHLTERLDELNGSPVFGNFQQAINTAIKLLNKQIDQINKVFVILNKVSSTAGCEQVITFLEDIFTSIPRFQDESTYLFLLDYVHIADCLLKESAEMAELSLVQLPELNLPQFSLYSSANLGPLKILLKDSGIAI